ncbi:MAG: hypothetical protein ACRDRI_24205 [Pseudonocardiaceae bacterium]
MTAPVPHGRTRVDGVAKVTGAARYAAEWPAADLRHAVLVTAAVPAARITRLDTGAAERAPGVVAVFTHANAPRLSPPAGALYGGRLPLQDDHVCYEGEPIAVVVADRWERARAAALLIRAEYAAEPAVTDLDTAAASAYVPTSPWGPADTSVGDVDAGLGQAAVIVQRQYTTAGRHHCPIETSATSPSGATVD